MMHRHMMHWQNKRVARTCSTSPFRREITA